LNAPGGIDQAVRAVVREELHSVFREELRLAVQELQSATPTPKEFLSVPDAAELLDVSQTTVREWMANGLRHYRQGRVLGNHPESSKLAAGTAEPGGLW